MRKQLKPYQYLIIKYICEHKRCGIFVPMGMGKTVSVLTAISLMRLRGEDVGKVLIVAPLRVAAKTWPDEVRDWDHLSHMKISAIVGSAKQRREALNTRADLYTINYENLPWLEKELTVDGEVQWPFEMVVADESTKLKSYRVVQGGTRPRVLGKQAFTKIKRFVQLTGTPAANGLKDMWATGWFIDKGERLGRTYQSFTSRWFQRGYNGFSLDPLPHAQEAIEKRLADVCFSLNVNDHFDIEKPIEKTISVELPEKARKEYTKMFNDMVSELSDILTRETFNLEAVNAAVKTNKCRQLANGAAYIGDSGEWLELHKEKLDALEDIIEECNNAPIVVAYHFKSDLERLKKRFPQGKVFDSNPKTQDDWNAGKIPLLFAHPASCGHGLSLQHGGNILVFFSTDWNLENHQQIIERIGPVRQKQSGYERPVFVYYIEAQNTVDQLVRTRLKTKKSVQELLLEALNINKGI